MERNNFILYIILSASLHFLLLFYAPRYLISASKNNPNPKELKVEIQILKKSPEINKITPQPKNQQLTNDKIPPAYKDPPLLKNKLSQKDKIIKQAENILPKSDIDSLFLASNETITSEAVKDENYMHYYKHIRQKIKLIAEKEYQSTSLKEKGDITLSFTLLRDGSLYSIILLSTNTKSEQLIKIATDSVKKAAPFPPFPEELRFSQLPFQITIHFKNN